jgi:hypothetical protein
MMTLPGRYPPKLDLALERRTWLSPAGSFVASRGRSRPVCFGPG